MEVKIDLENYAKKLATTVINTSIMQDRVYESIVDPADQAKVFFLVAEKLIETGNELLSLQLQKKWTN